MVVKWFENKSFCLASSYVGVHLLLTTRRYNKTTKSRVEVSMFQIVKHYNAHMGCVDHADILIKISCTHIKTHKWYIKNIFPIFGNLSANNVWLQYRKTVWNRKKKRLCVSTNSKYMLKLLCLLKPN
ncbi:piggyBac transposable element-derived protein 3-like [Aphis craccivora]|uniref:PiggyBac transposable element-derived protein 3-like n=1 Tax=Aphis craccivora TaxID=307492 RepID=A0A6G0Y8C0_APHCR|nr:piggyBac transposable element-derived protein 3-like [Aphis craccivora]